MGRIVVGVLIALLAIGGTLLVSNSDFAYLTGWHWYDACWRKLHTSNHEAQSPEQAAIWSQCDALADKTFYGDGYIYAGNPQWAVTPQLKAIQAACPNAYNEIPVGGWWITAVGLIESSGGPSAADRFLPPGEMILRVLHERWPKCPEVRQVMGFPKMVSKSGNWDWETKCEPCEAEEKAIVKDNQEQAEAEAWWATMTDAEKAKEEDAAIDAAFPKSNSGETK